MASNKGYGYGGGSASGCVFNVTLNSSTTLELKVGSGILFSTPFIFGSHHGAKNTAGGKGSNAGIKIPNIASIICYGGGGANKSPGAGGNKPTINITNSSNFELITSSAGHCGYSTGRIND